MCKLQRWRDVGWAVLLTREGAAAPPAPLCAKWGDGNPAGSASSALGNSAWMGSGPGRSAQRAEVGLPFAHLGRQMRPCEGSDLSWKVPGEQKAHTLHRGRCSLQEAALQRASLGLDSQGWRELSLWAKLSHQAPTDQPCRNTDSGALSQPLIPRQAGLKVGATLSKSEKHTKFTAKPLQSKPGPLPKPASLPGSMPSTSRLAPGSQLTPGTRSHVSCAGGPRGRV